MKRFLLLGILLISFINGYSQTISKPDRSAIVCLGTDLGVTFTIGGTFADGSEFEVQLSDATGSFASYTTFTDKIPYVSGETSYSGLFLVSGIAESVDYKIRIRSTSGGELSPESDPFRVIQNDPVSIMADGPTEFCTGGSVILKTSNFVDTRTYDWYKVGSPPVFLGTSQTWSADETGEFYALSTGNCVEESNHISVFETITPTSVILEAETDVDDIFDVCFPGSFTFNANSTDIDSPYYEWLDSSDNVVGTGATFTTGVEGSYRLRTINQGNLSPGGGCDDISSAVQLVVHDFVSEILEQPNSPITGCEGTAETLTSSETNPDYIYHWYKDGVEITGLVQPAITLDVIGVVSSNGKYTLDIETPACNKLSTEVDITFVLTPISQMLVDTDQEICLGNDFILTQNSQNKFGTTTYQWIKDGIDIPGATGETYATGLAGFYSLRTTNNGICSDESAPIELTVKEVISEIGVKQGDLSICEGSVLELESKIEQDPSYIYRWYKDGVEITGLTQPAITYLVPSGFNEGVSSSGAYTLTIESAVCSPVTSAAQHVKIKSVPIFEILINNQLDRDLKSCLGDVVELKSTIIDIDYEYEWFLDGVPAPGINNESTYTFSVDASSQGEYRLKMSFASDCSKNKRVDILLVDTPTSVIDPASEAVACIDNNGVAGSVTLTALSVGNLLTYEWFRDGNLIVGETGPTITTNIAGKYSLSTTSDATCSTLSGEVDVIISETPKSIILDPGYLENCTNVLLEVNSDLKGEDASRAKYEWLDADDNLITTGLSLDVTTEGTHVYKLKTTLYDMCSDIAEVTVKIVPYESVILGTNDVEVREVQCIGTPFSLSSKFTDINFTYAWYKDAVVSGSEIGTNSTLNLNGDLSNAGTYILVVDGYNCSKQSNDFIVEMVKTPVALIKDDGNNFSGCSDVLLESVSTELEAPTTYQWYKDDVEIVGATSSSYLATVTGKYSLEVTNKNSCTTISTYADVKIDDLSAEILPGNRKECLGHDIVLEAEDKNAANTYTWIEIVNGVEVDIPNSNSDTYTVIADVAKVKTYKLRVANQSSCEKTSNVSVDVIIKDTPVSEIYTNNDIFEGCRGDEILLKSRDVDPDFTYIWYKNGAPTGTGTELRVTLSNQVDDVYKLSVVYGSCYVESEVSVHMIKTPVADITPSEDQFVCDDTQVILDGTSSTELENPVYQWFISKDDGAIYNRIDGAVNVTYTVVETGWYKLQVINSGNCSDFSNVVFVDIIPTPVAVITPDTDQKVCNRVTLTSNSTNLVPNQNDVSYEWYYNGNLVPTVTGQSIEAKSEGDYYFIVFNKGVCSSTSKEVNVSFTAFPHQIVDGDYRECLGHDVLLESQNKDEDNYSFAWYKEGDDAFPITQDLNLIVSGDVVSNDFYYLVVTEKGTNCSKQSKSVQVLIKEAPISDINIGQATNCEGSYIEINSLEKDTEYDYAWYFEGNEITVEGDDFSNIHSPSLTVLMSDATVGNYQVKVSIGSCVGSPSPEKYLDMYDMDPQLVLEPGNVLCADEKIKISVSAIGDISEYQWFWNGYLMPRKTSDTIIVDKKGFYKVRVESKDTGCIQFTDEIKIVTAPDMGVVEDTMFVQIGETTTFEAYGGDDYTWYEESEDGDDGPGDVVQEGGDTFQTVSTGNAEYYVEITNNSYCTELIKLLVISGEITAEDIQNIMTPNGDGSNDVWELPPGFVAQGDEVIILNRQGAIVYKTTDYQNDWGGTFNDGPALPAATYYYVIKRKDRKDSNDMVPIMGSITIFR